ncbi:hypothetical protein ASPSYDRAFT_464798 [Aspergillus sydowii CBS 593.65]|uniref:Uncharacterized protein n=1 Tax=Aspergillus sydowii CBS 593.65 TaxID=1036612 RepID=A0A1L9T4T7_9EURO|nr:uncharacterized protein ASPSYDRAFT_464798 [Aspergillus sydowii CBS 593.65]OJJ54418.1 hypothetical protein ASPSYDRAFT_464798 [Aspergillus sydowii CBS 593.65]
MIRPPIIWVIQYRALFRERVRSRRRLRRRRAGARTGRASLGLYGMQAGGCFSSLLSRFQPLVSVVVVVVYL